MRSSKRSSMGLADNPFAVLDISIDSSREDIASAFDDRLADGEVAGETLRNARDNVLKPNSRLLAALSFLPDAHDEIRRTTLAALHMGGPYSDLLALSKELPPLSQANLLAEIGAARPSAGIVRSFVAAQAAIDMSALSQILVAAHQRAGVPTPASDAIADALDSVMASNAKRVFIGYGRPEDAATAIVQCLEQDLSDADTTVVRAYTNLLNVYSDVVSAPMLNLRRQMEHVAEKIRSGESGPLTIKELETALKGWDHLAQPQQLMALHKGRDEQQSRDLFEFLRGLSLDLANKLDDAPAALAISKVSMEVFAELPRATRQLQDDIATLDGLVAQEGAKKLLHFVEEARKDFDPLVHSLDAQGFGRSSTGIAGHLYNIFDESVTATRGTAAAELPWGLVRGLALDINNDLGEAKASEALIKGLSTHPHFGHAPTDIQQSIRADLRILKGNQLQARLTKAVNAKDRGTARQVLVELVNFSDTPAERGEWQKMLDALDRARRGQFIKFGIWAVIILGIIIAVSNQGSRTGSSTYRPSSSTPSPSSNMPGGTAPSTVSRLEVRPAAGTNLVLNRDNIRYCLYNSERLDAIDSSFGTESSGVIRQFNAAIDDWNARCSSYRYRQADMTAVQGEVRSRMTELRAEGLRTLQNWRTLN